MQVWDPAYFTDPATVLEKVDLSGISVPTYLLYASGDTDCPLSTNGPVLDDLAAIKRRIEYDGFNHDSFYTSDPKITTDVITILGSGAHALIAAASAVTLASLV